MEEIDIGTVLKQLGQLGIAFALALPVALDRERETRALGLRTFPLVAIASAGFVQIAQSVTPAGGAEMARVLQGLMTGVGFLGGGAILKGGGAIRGTATAASIWSTAAMGAAVAFSRFEIAIALTVANFATLRWLRHARRVIEPEEESEADSDRLDGREERDD